MNDFRLRSLLAVVRTGSFSAAAEILHVTQPAVSQHIRQLEEFYGSRLLSRVGRRTVPTPTGSLLFEYAESIESLYRSMDRDIFNAAAAVRTFDVGATLTIAEYLLPPLLGQYRKLNAHVRIRMTVQNTKETIDRLIRNQITLAMVEGPFDRGSLHTCKFIDDEMVAVCAPEYELKRANGGSSIPIAALLASDLILREPGSGTRTVLEHYLMRHGMDPRSIRVYMEIGSINAIKSLVSSELGVTVVSRSAVERELKEGKLVQLHLDGGPILRELQFVWNDYSDAGFVEEFIGFCTAATARPPG